MDSFSENNKKKRKRTFNTSREQYEEYLALMENNYTVRSGTMNPTLDDGYLHSQWQQLTLKLNSIGNGPQLTIEEWKKRFNDWKNTTRAKYRKINECRLRTGGGEKGKTKLTDLEERGISVWGRVVVTGSKNVPESCLPGTDSMFFVNIPDIVENVSITDDTVLEEQDKENNSSNVLPVHLESVTNNVENINKSTHKRKYKRRPKPFSETVQNLLHTYEQNASLNKTIDEQIKKYVEKYSEVEDRKLELENIKLNFEIEKYKFENKNFVFDY